MRRKVQSTFLGKYVNKRKLGKGAFGDVYLVEDPDHQQLALKIIDKQKMKGDNEDMMKYLKGEVDCMKHMDCEHIVQLHDFQEDEEFYYMVLEYCDGGDLCNEQAKQKNKVYSLDVATQYLAQVIKGLETLHQEGYLHRDIKMQNVIIKNENGVKVLKIAGFGFAKKAINLSGTVLGIEQYMSPEIYRCGIEEEEVENSYGYEVDMWAFGVVLYYMLNMTVPFEMNPHWTLDNKFKELSSKAKNFSYKKAVMTTRKKIQENCTEEVEDLFRKIFEVKAEKRITFAEIRQHPVFAKHFPKASQASQILYNTKFKSKIQKKSGFKNNLGSKLDDIKQKTVGPSSLICVDEENDFPKEKEILCLEVEEIQFLWKVVEDLQIAEKQIGSQKSLLFAFNLVKYYIVLLKNHIQGLSVANYAKKYKSLKLQWQAMFSMPEFMIHKKNAGLKVNRAEMRHSDLYSKCACNLAEIKKLNPFFGEAFSEVVDQETEFSNQFFNSYRKSTDIMYSGLKQYLKTNKVKAYYYYLCVVCICHVFNDFYANPELKTVVFDTYLRKETEQTMIFSYQRLVHYLKTSEKETLVQLALKIIEECMMK